jgi:hypothetical protein
MTQVLEGPAMTVDDSPKQLGRKQQQEEMPRSVAFLSHIQRT